MSGPLIQLQLRRDTAAIWTSTNPVLAEGEKGIETDTGFHKIGDGSTAWNSLGYYHGPPWLQSVSGGSPSSSFGGAPDNPHYGVMAYEPYIEPPIEFGISPPWYLMDALGRGPNANELMVIGQEAAGTLDLGVFNMDTNLFTTVVENTFLGTTLTTCYGIDMDRSTGVIVAIQGNSTSNTYPAFWSDDLGATWTQCSSPSTNFHGQKGIAFDEAFGIWIWSTGAKTFVSNDGKAFVQQQLDFDGYGTFDMSTMSAFLHSGFFGTPAFSGLTSERLAGWNPTTDTVPVPTAGNTEVWEGYSISAGGLFVNPVSPNWNAGITVFEDEIYFASTTGEIIKSPNGGRGIGNWSVVAADNEITDGFTAFQFMKEINGVFWWCSGHGGSGKWYRWGTGGAPVGYGWVQDNTGPFGTTTVSGGVNWMQSIQIPGQRFAYIGAEDDGFPIDLGHIYYDVNS